MYVNVYSGHKGCGKLLHGMAHSWQNFYFDGYIRYRKSKDIMMTGVQNIVTSKHATYLEFPPLEFEPRFSFWPFYLELALKKLVPGETSAIRVKIDIFFCICQRGNI